MWLKYLALMGFSLLCTAVKRFCKIPWEVGQNTFFVWVGGGGDLQVPKIRNKRKFTYPPFKAAYLPKRWHFNHFKAFLSLVLNLVHFWRWKLARWTKSIIMYLWLSIRSQVQMHEYLKICQIIEMNERKGGAGPGVYKNRAKISYTVIEPDTSLNVTLFTLLKKRVTTKNVVFFFTHIKGRHL